MNEVREILPLFLETFSHPELPSLTLTQLVCGDDDGYFGKYAMDSSYTLTYEYRDLD